MQRAFFLWIGMIVLNLVNSLTQAVGVGSGSAGGVVGALLGGAFGVYLALHFRGGRQWARVVLTVLTAIALLLGVFAALASLVALALLPVVGVVLLAVSGAMVAACVLVLVLAWKPDASAYFGIPTV